MLVLQVEKYGSIWNQCFLFWNNNYSAITRNSESVTAIVMFSLLQREGATVKRTKVLHGGLSSRTLVAIAAKLLGKSVAQWGVCC